MPNYSIFAVSATLTKASPRCLLGASGPDIYASSYRMYGRDVPSNISGPPCALSFHVTGSGAAFVPEKFNSRSGAAVGTFTAATADTVVGVAPQLLLLGNIVTHNAVLFGTRYRPVASSSELLRAGAGNGTFSHTLSFSQDRFLPSRRVRRTTKPGYFPVFGNSNICDYQLTGGGAYQFFAPSFDTDVYWTDVRAWQNGTGRAGVWNINLLSGKRRLAEIFYHKPQGI